jgi:hypothetical protein
MGEGWTQYWYMGEGSKVETHQVDPRKVLDPREEQRRRGHLQEHFDLAVYFVWARDKLLQATKRIIIIGPLMNEFSWHFFRDDLCSGRRKGTTKKTTLTTTDDDGGVSHFCKTWSLCCWWWLVGVSFIHHLQI